MDSVPTENYPNKQLAPTDRLKTLVAAGSALAGLSKTRTNDSSKTLIAVIKTRLREFNDTSASIIGPDISSDALESGDVEELTTLTATKSLEILERVQSLLQEYDVDLPAHNNETTEPRVAVGTRDLGVLRTLTSVVFGLPASQAIVSLGGVNQPLRPTATEAEGTRSTPVAVPPYVQKAASGLLSRQVLRPDGISGLCAAVFGEGEEVAPLVKLERVARLLTAVPSQMDRETYMRAVIPNLIALLGPAHSKLQSQSAPTSYKRAAAFTLSRMLTTSRGLTLRIVFPLLHGPFIPSSNITPSVLSVSDAISTLTTLFTSTDPSPLLAQTIIEPILVPLYNLSAYLDAQRVSDPMLKESVHGLLRTWARLVARDEAITGLWNVVQGVGGWGLEGEIQWSWDVGEEGLEIVRASAPKPIPLSVLQGANEDGELGDADDDNPLSLRPNPAHFAKLLKSLERKDVASALFVRILNEYQIAQRMKSVPLRLMLFLRLVLELQQKLGSSVLTEPEHILQFVAHAIEPQQIVPEPSSVDRRMGGLRIVGADSDDENDPETIQEQDEMALTAVTLLLSILEVNENLSTNSSPLLAMIYDYLEPLTSSEDESLRTVSREARLVLISRRSLSDSLSSTTNVERSDLETYQEALRLIQDPILPVRAHGLHMLRQLVVPPKAPKGVPTTPLPELDPALVPGILDIFLQSVQEEDSFVFLNAVQGLSAMVDRLGREILQSLLRIYAGGIEAGRQMERAELDKRVRVGEVLVQVVRRCGDALGLHTDMIVPPLFRVIRAEGLPTILRSSALSVLAQCVETSPAALTPWLNDILSGMIDILQIESVRASPLTRAAREEPRLDTTKTAIDEEIDARPQNVDSKSPPFRRSALLCFALVVRSMIAGVYEGSNPVQRGALWNRARTLLDYLRITDSDSIVRVQAAETLGLVKQLGRAELGLESSATRKIRNSPFSAQPLTSPEVFALAPPKQLYTSLAAMSSVVSAAPHHDKKKKKSTKHVSGDVGHPPANTTKDGDVSQSIQNAIDHVRASEVVATSSSSLATSHGGQPGTKAKKRPNTDDTSPTVQPDATQLKAKKKKKQHGTSATLTAPSLGPSHTISLDISGAPDLPQLASAYVPSHMTQHIPIDPALTQTDQIAQPPHPHTSANNSPFVMDANASALQHQDNSNTDAYIFNQDSDMAMLGSNEDILRALQGFDISKFTELATENPESVHLQPGPSTAGDASQSRARTKKTVAPQPTGQIVNPEHADILATHWLNPAKLADLVKSQGLVYKKGKFSAVEEHQIEEALQNYATEKNLTSAEIDGIIFSKGKKAKEEYSTFWSEITRAVPQRPIIAVYHHVRRTHHPMKQQGKWTPEEDATVIAAVAELGQKWEQISERVGRMSSDCRDRYRNHLVDQDARVSGPWTKEEEEELTKIVLELTVERGLQADNDVLWSAVSERMGGRRTRQQVRIKWTDALNKRVKNSGEKPRWNAQDAYILVHKVASMPVQDDTEIDWKLLPDPQWNLWSAHQLQRRWFGLKKTLKDADTMPHSEIIAILQSKFSEPPEQPNAPRRYETKKSRTNAISREFINDEEAGFEDFTDPNGLFPQTSDGNSIDPELVRETQEQLEAVLQMAQHASASGTGTHE
ncbi:hypothetical protein FRC07_003743 [Ceratobasidium sp. 392]|nr:hypothetical protein FRC07_003743 [Ceratobasidium sp. 392]